MALLARIVPCWLVMAALVIGTADADAKKKPESKPVPAAEAKPAKKAEKKPAQPAAKKAEAKKPAPKKPEPKKVEAEKEASKPAPKPAAKPAPKPAPKTHTVKKDRLKLDLTLKGSLQATQERVFTLRPRIWQVWRVAKAVRPGTVVKKGDTILQFDTRQIDQAIKDIEANQAYNDLAYQAAQQELTFLEETIPLDMANAERSKKYFDQDYKYYFEKQLPLSRKIAENQVKSYENYLAYEKEELAQLEKMYKADDLTEETEEIIIARQRHTVKRMEFLLEQAKAMRDQTMKMTLPRQELATKDNKKIAELRLKAARMALPRMLAQKRLELQKMTRDREKALTQLKKMKEDRALMTLRTPIEGVIYYGGHVRGSFTSSATVAQMLKPGVVVKPNTTLMTIASPKPMVLHTSVSEASLRYVKKGMAGRVIPTAYPDMRVNAKVGLVSNVPLTPGKFDVIVALDPKAPAPGLVPGMTAAVKMRVYDKRDAISVPPSVVHVDENDDTKYHVYVLQSNGKAKKVNVSVGHRLKSKTEITRGLKEGDKVLLEKPKS